MILVKEDVRPSLDSLNSEIEEILGTHRMCGFVSLLLYAIACSFCGWVRRRTATIRSSFSYLGIGKGVTPKKSPQSPITAQVH